MNITHSPLDYPIQIKNISWAKHNKSSTSKNNANSNEFNKSFINKILLGSPSTKKITINFLPNSINNKKQLSTHEQNKIYWHHLEKSIKDIFENEKLNFPLEYLYKCVEKLCRNEKIEVIYKKLGTLFENHIKTLNNFDIDDENLHVNFNKVWSDFCIDIRFINNIFIVLDRQYLLKMSNLSNIWEMATKLFKKHLINSNFSKALIKKILIEINKERKDISPINTHLLASLIYMLSELNLYDNHFEKSFLKETEQIYETESKELVEKLSIKEYLDHISSRIKQEEHRVHSYLQESTNKKILLILVNNFLKKNLKKILKTGLASLINADYDSITHLEIPDNPTKHKYLKLLHFLASQYKEGYTIVKEAFQDYVVLAGSSIILQCEDDNDHNENDKSNLTDLSESDSKKPNKNRKILENRRIQSIVSTESKLEHIENDLINENTEEQSDSTNISKNLNEPAAKTDVVDQKITPNAKDQHYIIEQLLAFKDKLDEIVENCFKSSLICKNALRDACEIFINKRQIKPAELIAKFIDSKMRNKAYLSENAEVNETHFETTFNKIMVLFRFIQGKDIFEAFYKYDLGKRLIYAKSNVDLEKNMLTMLKYECGAQFTAHLDGMFRDIEASKELNNLFKNSKDHNLIDENEKSSEEMVLTEDLTLPKVEFLVLTKAHWPKWENYEIELPISSQLEAFKDYYLKQNTGRKLSWHHFLGNVILSLNPLEKKYEFDVSIAQALILLEYNNKDEFTVDEIVKNTKLIIQDVKRSLQSLAFGKHRVLLKVKDKNHIRYNPEIKNTDTFIFNKKFESEQFRIKILNPVQQKDTKKKQFSTESMPVDDTELYNHRKFLLEAKIMWIMKASLTKVHNDLMCELFKVIKFPLDVTMVKNRIEHLIDSQYLERWSNDDNTDGYKYIS